MTYKYMMTSNLLPSCTFIKVSIRLPGCRLWLVNHHAYGYDYDYGYGYDYNSHGYDYDYDYDYDYNYDYDYDYYVSSSSPVVVLRSSPTPSARVFSVPSFR